MKGVEVQLKALMVRSLGGDGTAYAELLATLSRYLRGYFGRRLRSRPGDVEDLVQETLLAIHLKRHSYDTPRPFTPWVYAMARYKLLDHYRRSGIRRTISLEDAGILFAAENTEEGAVRADLAKLLSQLPNGQRAIVMDVKISGLTMEEAAERNRLTVTAVKVRLHRALKALSGKVGDDNR